MLAGLDGDGASHAALLELAASLLRAFYRRRIADADDIEDLVQETLIAVHERRASYDRRRPFSPWLFAIARNECLRRAGSRPEAPASVREPGGPADGNEARALRGAIEGLAPGERDLIAMLLHGLEIDGIAAVLGIDRESAYPRMSRALGELETATVALLVARSGRRGCPGLAALLGDWDGRLDVPLTKAQVRRFSDNEVFVVIEENVRGEDVFVIQSTSYPANDNLMELLICIDALTRASAKRITAVIPYFGYARQDRKTGGRTPISAKLVANLITRAGAHRVLTMDLHAGQIQGFFDIPTDNLVAIPFMAKDILANYKNAGDLMIVSPDVGGVVRARSLADRLGADLAIVDKRRPRAGESEVMNIIGDVTGRNCILFDDIVDSGGTLVNAAKALMDRGASSVSAYISHGVLSGAAMERVEKSVLKELVITDSIEATAAIRANDKVRIVGVAPLIGEAIRRIANEESVSKLFD